MKIEFIKRGAATRLILIFAGWSTDARYYNDCLADGWDTAVVSDYRDMKMPALPAQYSTVYVFAYSLGVYAASVCKVVSAVRIAICGSLRPVSDLYGIPYDIYKATYDGLNERQMMKFHLRMAGDRATYEKIKSRLPELADIGRLREELTAIAEFQASDSQESDSVFDRAYIAEEDRIFPYANVSAFWDTHPETVKISLKASHAIDMASIIKDVIPDTTAICYGFEKAKDTYNYSAIVQAEICRKIGGKLASSLSDRGKKPDSLLEIGVGGGLLTHVWRRVITPSYVTYIDLQRMPEFGIGQKERYLLTDAEKWLEATEEKFDLILSASTIQWFVDPVKFIRTVRTHLNPGGTAVISTFVKGNLWQLDDVRPSPIIYRTSSDYLTVEGVEGDSWESTLRFDSSRDMLIHLRDTGVTQKKKMDGHQKEKRSNRSLKGLSELPCELTYKPMILIIRK